MILVPAIAAGLAALYVMLEKYRKTSKGENAWTLDGFLSVMGIASHISDIARTTGASVNSVFRSPAIQTAVYNGKRSDPAKWAVVEAGAKRAGVSTEAYVARLSTGSRHSRGLAADFSGKPIAALADEIFALAKAGKIGPVKKVLNERDHVHVEWYGKNEVVKPPTLESL